jgi:hypothetical protein
MLGVVVLVFAGDPAQALVRKNYIDIYHGKRALDVADPDAGPLAPDMPSQGLLEEDFEIEWEGYTIEAVQGFGIEALVLGRKDYSEGDMGSLVPIDLAMAWGKVSDPAWVKHLKVEQSDRVYRWSFPRGTVLDQKTVETSSANMHIMPASPEILRKLKSVDRGDVVRLTGFLVNISKEATEDEDGFSWKSSLIRTDTGLGACELILVTSVDIEGR